MICNNCGATISDGNNVCPNCNTQLNHPESTYESNIPYEAPIDSNGSYESPKQNYFTNNASLNIGQNVTVSKPELNPEQKNELTIETARTLGILAIVLGVAVSRIAGLILASIGNSKLNDLPDSNDLFYMEKKASAKRLNRIGTILSAVMLAVSAVFIVFYILMLIFFSTTFATIS